MNRFVVIAVFVAASMTCPAATVFNENFEGAAPGYYSTLGVIAGTGFSLASGSIDVKGPGWYPLLCTGTAAGNCVDTVGGSGGTSGQKIETTSDLSLLSGTFYTLTFDLGNWTLHPPNDAYNIPHTATVRVTVGTYSEDFTIAFDIAPARYTRTFVYSSGSKKLAFENTASGATQAGLILDNVQVDSIPEPSSIALLGSGMLALLVAARRRRRV